MSQQADVLAQQVYDFVYAYDAAYEHAAQSVGLSSAQACLLEQLSRGSRTMGELAVALLCDASNVTQLAARLEARDLVARVADAGDRRVKRVSITPAGRRARRAFQRAFDFPSGTLGLLSEREQQQLSRLLAKALTPDPE